MQNRQPKICPLANYKGFPGHEGECPYGQNYLTECASFSKWFWYKVAQFQVEPITEEKIPQDITQKIYGRGWADAMKSDRRAVYSALELQLITDTLLEVVKNEGIVVDENFMDKFEARWKVKINP